MQQSTGIASFYKNGEPPLVGAASTIAELPGLRNWLLNGQRDLELNDMASPAVLDGGNWEERVAAAKESLEGFTGRLGIHGPFFGLAYDSIDPEIAKVAQARLLQGLDFAALLGATHVVVHSPFHPFYDFSNPKLLSGLVTQIHRALEPVVKKAEEIGCTIVIENILDYDSRGLIAVAKSFDSPRVRLSVDVGHAQIQFAHGGATPKQFILETGPYLEHVHLQDTDSVFDRHWAAGDGVISWYGVFEALAELGHTPRLIIETSQTNVFRSHDYFVSKGLAR